MRHVRTRSAGALLAVCIYLAGMVPVFAQDSLSVTVTPPLFQLTIGPGENWSSAIKVVNNNAYDVTYAPNVVDFEAQGELGQGAFIPLIENFADEPLATNSLGSWIEISAEPILISAGQSAEIPFTVRVPENADPGGHYAAIMVGPYQGDSTAGSHMKVSSFVTSLLFVRIKGDIVESGRVREFTTDASLYQKPEAHFVLRFENTGNTHLRPQGAITLYNMWGKERGQVLINEKSNFGNVLPRSVRKFEFAWSGEANLFEIGRYSAIVTLAYGDDGRQNTTAKTYFWIIPIIPVSITLGSILLIGLLLMALIRRYVRRALMLERMHRGIANHPDVPEREIVLSHPVPTLSALVQPLREGVVDLRSVGRASTVGISPEAPEFRAPLTLGAFLNKYRLFFLFMVLVASLISGIWLFFSSVLTPERSFEIQNLSEQTEEEMATQ